MRWVRTFLMLVLWSCCLLVQAEPAQHWSVGQQRKSVNEPVDGQPLHAPAV